MGRNARHDEEKLSPIVLKENRTDAAGDVERVLVQLREQVVRFFRARERRQERRLSRRLRGGDIRSRTGADSFIGVFSYAGMPYDIAESNMRLFADKVMPELKKLPAAADELTPA